jgi:transcriptional regulator with XRE-family HTH domain
MRPNKNRMSEIANKLKEIMLKRKLSARNLSKETGVPLSTISDVLSGRQPSIKTLQILARHLNVSLDYLVNGKNEPHLDLASLLHEDVFDGYIKIHIQKVITKSKKESQ